MESFWDMESNFGVHTEIVEFKGLYNIQVLFNWFNVPSVEQKFLIVGYVGSNVDKSFAFENVKVALSDDIKIFQK